MSFGYKTAWFAIRSSDTAAVVAALRLSDARPVTAQEGIEAAYQSGNAGGKVFITLPISGWTLAMSASFFELADSAPPRFMDTLPRISAELGTEAQFFATHRVVESHLWARAVDGELRRAYFYAGESGENKVDVGEPTPQERALGHQFFDPERADLRFAGEQDVMDIAGLWSIDPSTYDEMPDGLLADIRPTTMKPAHALKPWWRLW